MEILDRYIGKAVAGGVLGALFVMMTLSMLAAIAGEASVIGRANYTTWGAFTYVLLSMPQQMYMLFPMVALLGAMFGLGTLAGNSELIAVRAAGVSILRITLSVLKTGVILAAAAIFVGEIIAPPAVQYAKQKRVAAIEEKLSLNTDFGLWARDGQTYIHIRQVEDDGQLVGISLYQLDEARNLKTVIQASHAVYQEEQWLLHRVQLRHISATGISEEHKKTMPWKSLLSPDVVNVVSVSPENMSIWKLRGYIAYLRDNALDAQQYQLTFWSKIMAPLTISAMILIAIPFVFGSLRSSGAGQRILVGFMIGLGFYLFNELLGKLGLVYNLPPILAASLPTLVVIGIGVFMIYRTR